MTAAGLIAVIAVILMSFAYIFSRDAVSADDEAEILSVRRGNNTLSIYVDCDEPLESCEVQIGSHVYDADNYYTSF